MKGRASATPQHLNGLLVTCRLLECADSLIGWHVQVDSVVDVVDPIGGNEVMISVERIVAGAKRHLDPGGILVVEVGNAAARVRRHFRDLPLTWLEFERGFAEVFLLRAADLPG